MNSRLIKFAAALIYAAVLTACTTTPTRQNGSQSSSESGVTVFGTIDTGVGAVRSGK